MLLSIITINFNNRDGLRRTCESVVGQSCRDFEFIVIDGGSTDGGREVIKEYEAYFDFWSSMPDNGVYHAMNKGVRVAHGDYVLFLNSGDTFYDHDVVKRVLPLLKDCDVLTGGTWLSSGRLIPAPHTVTMGFLYGATLCHQSSFIRRELLSELPYDEDLRYVSDWKFWVQALIFRDGVYRHTDVVVSNYDWNGMSTVNYKEVEKEKEQALLSFFPKKVWEDYHKYVIGDGWEDKLYIAIKGSRFHAVIYSFNVCLIKFLQLFKKGAFWINEYPVRLK